MRLAARLCEGQRVTDWQAMVKQGIGLVIFPVPEGGMESDGLLRQIQECGQAELDWGLYLRMPLSQWEAGESLWTELLADLEKMADDRERKLRVLMDVTDMDAVYRLNREVLCEGIVKRCEALRAAGTQPVIYGNKYWHTVFLQKTLTEEYARWIAQYHRECTYAGAYEAWEFTSAFRMAGVEGMLAVAQLSMPDEEVRRAGEMQLPKLKGYIGTSLAGALNRVGYPSDLQSRRQLAVRMGYTKTPEAYVGSAAQNREILRLLGGTISQSRILREGAYIRILPEAKDVYTGRRFEARIYNNTFQILSLSGTALVFGICGNAIGTTARNTVSVVN